MFYIAICDDDKYFRLREQELVGKYMESKGFRYKIDFFESGKELLNIGNRISNFDVLFLDINMEEINGIETARRIREITKDTYIVFVTAFAAYALEGYKVDAVRYLLKDDTDFEKIFHECLETIIYKKNYKEYKYTFDFLEGKVELFLEDILYIESNLHKLKFYLIENCIEKYTMYERLDVMDEKLQEYGFCRIHKSYLINLKYVESMERYKAELTTGINLGISKSRYLQAKQEFSSYRGEYS